MKIAKVQMTLPKALSSQSQDWFLMTFKMYEWLLNRDVKEAKDRLKVFKLLIISLGRTTTPLFVVACLKFTTHFTVIGSLYRNLYSQITDDYF